MKGLGMPRLAIITTHPIQYYAPWFRYMANSLRAELRVFYLWDFGVVERHDPQFRRAIQWDVPLLDGYDYEFVPNRSRRPGTDGFTGIWNPGLLEAVHRFDPDAVLLLSYNFASTLHFIARWGRRTPLLFRGDSHRLVPRHGAMEALRQRALRALFG